MSHKSWCFTLNNYSPDHELNFQNFGSYSYMCYGREIGESGTKHLQGVLTLVNSQRMSFLKAQLGSKAHWEPCRSVPASIVYCKKDGDYFENNRRRPRGPRPSGVDIPRQPSGSLNLPAIDRIVEDSFNGIRIRF